MRVSFVHVGDELLTGQLDPCPSKLIRAVRERRAEVVLVAVVRDEVEEIVGALDLALRDATDIAVVTGGLGPTLDDVTREAVASFLGAGLRLDEGAVRWMDEALERMHGSRSQNEVRLRMARVPEGTSAVCNITGAACGIDARKDGMRIFCLPGFPNELEPMFERYVLPLVGGEDYVELETTVWKGESTLEPLFQEVASKYRVRVASLPSVRWREEGNKVVIKGAEEEARRAMEHFLKRLPDLGEELSCR